MLLFVRKVCVNCWYYLFDFHFHRNKTIVDIAAKLKFKTDCLIEKAELIRMSLSVTRLSGEVLILSKAS